MNQGTIKKLQELPAYGSFIDWTKLEKDVPDMLVGAYPNSDTDHIFESIINTYAQEIVHVPN